jgi:hypothetical protein
VRHRLNRGGNRQLNSILYRIALTQLRTLPAAQAYVARRMGEGKTKREALRALKRHLVRAIFRLWQECLRGAPEQPIAHAALSMTGAPRGRTQRLSAASGGAVA